jgi:hypothetical protein
VRSLEKEERGWDAHRGGTFCLGPRSPESPSTKARPDRCPPPMPLRDTHTLRIQWPGPRLHLRLGGG